MATISQVPSQPQRGVRKVLWETLTNGDDGAPVELARYARKSVQVLGTFGTGGTVKIEGSNDGGTTWHTLNDPQGNALSITAAGVQEIQENTQQVRPNVTAGDGTTDLDVHLVAVAEYGV